MSTLARTQNAFFACLLDEDAPVPNGWGPKHAAGMAIYRNAYRARLLDALGETFERTARLVGADAFHRAAAHYLIAHPPSGWSLDLAGEGFADTCAELFARDPDVAELAWLEWAMHRAFTAADQVPLDRAGFAERTAGFDARDWDALRLELVAGTELRPVAYDLVKLWQSLGDPGCDPQVAPLQGPAWVLTWREGEQPVFVLISQAEGETLDALRRGTTFGACCGTLAERIGQAEAASAAAGMLTGWLDLGVIRAVQGA